jgi:hypothetical protein
MARPGARQARTIRLGKIPLYNFRVIMLTSGSWEYLIQDLAELL